MFEFTLKVGDPIQLAIAAGILFSAITGLLCALKRPNGPAGPKRLPPPRPHILLPAPQEFEKPKTQIVKREITSE